MKVNKDLEGMSLPDIAEQRGTSLGETLINLLIEEDGQICYRGAPPDSVRVWDQVSRDAMEFLSRPDYMVGSDAIPIGSMPHPRAYGCFPRFLGRLRKKHPVISLEQTVQRMTDNPARRFGLTDRGRIERGCATRTSSSSTPITSWTTPPTTIRCNSRPASRSSSSTAK